MKLRLLIVPAIAALILGLAACGDDDDSSSDDGATTEATTRPKRPRKPTLHQQTTQT